MPNEEKKLTSFIQKLRSNDKKNLIAYMINQEHDEEILEALSNRLFLQGWEILEEDGEEFLAFDGEDFGFDEMDIDEIWEKFRRRAEQELNYDPDPNFYWHWKSFSGICENLMNHARKNLTEEKENLR